jgi:ADP-ribose pyrophosphatase
MSIADETRHAFAVREHRDQPVNKVFSLVSDEVEMPGGAVVRRDYIRHVGAVGVVAVNERREVLLIEQYRHPVGRRLWELPAGLTDMPGEPPLDTARRELAEEADLRAEHWQPLIDLHPTPGSSNERIQLFLAQGISEIPHADRHEREDEEADLRVRWFALDAAIEEILARQITNAAAVAGILAAARLLGGVSR